MKKLTLILIGMMYLTQAFGYEKSEFNNYQYSHSKMTCKDILEDKDDNLGEAFDTIAEGTGAGLILAIPVAMCTASIVAFPVVLGAGLIGEAGVLISAGIIHIHAKTVLKTIDQAARGEGKLLRRVYKKYKRLVNKLNKENDSNSTDQIAELNFSEFKSAIIAADQDGSLCNNGLPSKKNIGIEIIGMQERKATRK